MTDSLLPTDLASNSKVALRLERDARKMDMEEGV